MIDSSGALFEILLKLFDVSDFLFNVILNCITTSSISVLVNEGALEPFQPSCGIR